MRKVLLLVLTLAALLAVPGFCFAQMDIKPYCTLSIAGYDNLINKIGAIGETIGDRSIDRKLETSIKSMTGGKGLVGLDPKQPIGYAMWSEQDTEHSIFFLPVSDAKQLMGVFQGIPMLGSMIQLKGDVYEMAMPGTTYCAQAKGQWLIVAANRGDLAKAPADPSKLLGSLPKRYDVALRVSTRDLPQKYREQVVAGLKAGMAKPPAGDDLANELEELVLGLAVDTDKGETNLEVEVTARNGTKLADNLAILALPKPGPSTFCGLLTMGAPVAGHWAGTMSDQQVALVKDALAAFRQRVVGELESEGGLSARELKRVTGWVDRAVGALQKPADNAKADAGMAMLLDAGNNTVVGGVAGIDGAELAKVLKELAEEAQTTNPEWAKSLKVDVENHGGVRLHTISTANPLPDLVPFLGDSLYIVVGTAADRLWFATGANGMATLKKAVDQCKAEESKEASPMKVACSMSSLFKYAAASGDNPQVKMGAAMASGLIAQAGDKDHVTVTIKPIPQGARFRISLEEGLVKLLVANAQMFNPMGGMGAPPGMAPGGMPPGGPGAAPPGFRPGGGQSKPPKGPVGPG